MKTSEAVAKVAAAAEALRDAAAAAAELDRSVRNTLLPKLERACSSTAAAPRPKKSKKRSRAAAMDVEEAARALARVRSMQPALAMGAAVHAAVGCDRRVARQCVVCCNDVFALDAATCGGGGGHTHCVECVRHMLGSVRVGDGLNAFAKRGNVLRCMHDGCGRTVDVLDVAHPLLSVPGRAAAVAEYAEARAAAAVLQARMADIKERGARETESLDAKILRVLEGVNCPACDALYDASTDACMHASCSVCGTAFCGFCFRLGCSAEACALNARPGYITCSEWRKPAQMLLLKATRIAALVRDVAPAVRAAALARVAPRLAAHDAQLVADSPTLLVPRGANSAAALTPRLLFDLRAAYGGGALGDAAPAFRLADLVAGARVALAGGERATVVAPPNAKGYVQLEMDTAAGGAAAGAAAARAALDDDDEEDDVSSDSEGDDDEGDGRDGSDSSDSDEEEQSEEEEEDESEDEDDDADGAFSVMQIESIL